MVETPSQKFVGVCTSRTLAVLEGWECGIKNRVK